MRKQSISIILAASLFTVPASCKKDAAPEPIITKVQLAHKSIGNLDSIVMEVALNKAITFKVTSDADLCTLWPAGDRLTMKSVLNPTTDSLDAKGRVALVRSDDYKDYTLLGARGKMMSGSPQTGYTFSYTYTRTGTYAVVIIPTRHGISDDQFSNLIYRMNVVVK